MNVLQLKVCHLSVELTGKNIDRHKEKYKHTTISEGPIQCYPPCVSTFVYPGVYCKKMLPYL